MSQHIIKLGNKELFISWKILSSVKNGSGVVKIFQDIPQFKNFASFSSLQNKYGGYFSSLFLSKQTLRSRKKRKAQPFFILRILNGNFIFAFHVFCFSKN